MSYFNHPKIDEKDCFLEWSEYHNCYRGWRIINGHEVSGSFDENGNLIGNRTYIVDGEEMDLDFYKTTFTPHKQISDSGPGIIDKTLDLGANIVGGIIGLAIGGAMYAGYKRQLRKEEKERIEEIHAQYEFTEDENYCRYLRQAARKVVKGVIYDKKDVYFCIGLFKDKKDYYQLTDGFEIDGEQIVHQFMEGESLDNINLNRLRSYQFFKDFLVKYGHKVRYTNFYVKTENGGKIWFESSQSKQITTTAQEAKTSSGSLVEKCRELRKKYNGTELFRKAEALHNRKEYNEALTYFTAAADSGVKKGYFYLGLYYSRGHGVTKNTQLAKQNYEKAAEAGFPEAMNNLGLLYENENNTNMALCWYKKAAIKGYQFAIENYKRLTGKHEEPVNKLPNSIADTSIGSAIELFDGNYYKKAYEMFVRECDMGSKEANYYLGLYYLYGYGVIAKDRDRALEYFKRAQGSEEYIWKKAQEQIKNIEAQK